tara:strand:- start:1504 stop:1716 length:213 start_codon:yes stop_codon:yes gene_type:complete
VALEPKQLTTASCMAGEANFLQFDCMDRFKGDQHNASKHPYPDTCEVKKAIIVGSNNSAHKIANRIGKVW